MGEPSSKKTRAVPTKNLIRTVCVTDRAVLGRRTITSVGMADVRSVEVDGRLASFGRSSGRRVSVHGLQAPAIRGSVKNHVESFTNTIHHIAGDVVRSDFLHP